MSISNSTPTSVSEGTQQGQVILVDTSASPYTTTDTLSPVPGSDVDSTLFSTIGYTIQNTGGTNTISFTVTGANRADFSDEVIVQASTTVSPSSTGSFSTFFAAFRYYRIKAKSTASGNSSTVQVAAVLKMA
jgi:hypothetical protein